MPLAFHKIDDRFEWGLTRNSVAGFERIVKHLEESSFRCPSELFEISFDDGYLSIFENVFRILQSGSLRAMVFIVTGFIGKDSSWDIYPGGRRFRHLDREQISILSESGIGIGSHTMTHRNLTDLSPSRLENELSESKRLLEDICGREVSCVSYPYGKCNERVAEAALKCGYNAGYTFYRNRKARSGDIFVQNMMRERSPIYLFDTPLSVMLKSKGLGRFERMKGRIIKSYNQFGERFATRMN